jgi:hypothetical protein
MHGGYRGSGVTINWNTTPSQNDPINIPTPTTPPIDNPKSNRNNIAKIVGITIGSASIAAITGAAAYYNRDKIQSSYNDLIGSYDYNRPVRNMAADERAQGFGEVPYGDVELVAGPADPSGIVREAAQPQQAAPSLLGRARGLVGNIISAVRPNKPASFREDPRYEVDLDPNENEFLLEDEPPSTVVHGELGLDE